MTRGISEADVWEACDALLLAGARPTIERVRQKIGRGSPNTVSPLLDAWFRGLGRRINVAGALEATPDVPTQVVWAATRVWEAALEETRREIEQRVRDRVAAATVGRAEPALERASIGASALLDNRLKESTGEHVAVQAQLNTARQQSTDLLERLRECQSDLSSVRSTAEEGKQAADDRTAASERRFLMQFDAERQARLRADERAESLEQLLAASRLETRLKEDQGLHASIALRIENERRAQELAAALAASRQAREEARALESLLESEQRTSLLAQAEAKAARDLLARFDTSPRTRRMRNRASQT